MLGVLYFIVGNAVRRDFSSQPRPIIEALIDRGQDYDHPDICLWQKRSRDLLTNPKLFDSALWCGGGYARGD
jgi:hypothetical protein